MAFEWKEMFSFHKGFRIWEHLFTVQAPECLGVCPAVLDGKCQAFQSYTSQFLDFRAP